MSTVAMKLQMQIIYDSTLYLLTRLSMANKLQSLLRIDNTNVKAGDI